MLNIENRSVELDAIRVISMIFIILCHIFSEQGILWGEYFNVGVIIFLFLSGYTTGRKNTYNWRSWFGKRFIRILPEYYIFLIIFIVVAFLLNCQFSSDQVLINLTLLQGLFPEYALPNIGHLWFVTCILICYLITPLLHKIFSEENHSVFRLVFLLFVIQIIAFALRPLGVSLVAARFAAYILGYYFSDIVVNTKGGVQTKRLTYGLSIYHYQQLF